MFYTRRKHSVRRVGRWLLMFVAMLWLAVEPFTEWVKEKTRQLVLWLDLKQYEDWLRTSKARWSAIPLFIVFLAGSPFKFGEAWLLYNGHWILAIVLFLLAKTLLGGMLKYVAVTIYGKRLFAIYRIRFWYCKYRVLTRLLADRIHATRSYQEAVANWHYVRELFRRERSVWAVALRSAHMHKCCLA